MIGLKLLVILATALFASSKTIKAVAQAADIGAISDVKGAARVFRDKGYNARLDFDLRLMDDLRTSNGRLEATFLDSSVVRLTEHSTLTIDEYIYDPDPSKSKMALNFASGTARFVTGALGRINKENIKITTPTADIAIRGTDFTCTVDELGRSLIILLPDANGDASGEIIVTTAMGSVSLNKPYEATTVNVYESTPSNPVILDLTLEIIDNLLIVSPPKAVEIQEEEATTEQADILDFDELDIDFLDQEFLDTNELEFTELDINYLDVNFLEDLLNIIDALAIGDEQDVLALQATSVDIRGTAAGQDPVTQITTLIQGQNVSLRRDVSSSVRLDITGAQAYTVILIQGGVSNTVTINGGGDSVIVIRQGS